MKGFAFMLWIGNWMLTHEGLFRWLQHQNKTGKTKWMDWTKVNL